MVNIQNLRMHLLFSELKNLTEKISKACVHIPVTQSHRGTRGMLHPSVIHRLRFVAAPPVVRPADAVTAATAAVATTFLLFDTRESRVVVGVHRDTFTVEDLHRPRCIVGVCATLYRGRRRHRVAAAVDRRLRRELEINRQNKL